ncbi:MULTISPECIES: nuclear transport factor 2 family protein [unclassified Arthrobacter]|uniref:nuclear transport factor 2 family protein n=1 Tax=unclassified Arthrobacter TaxID=235627 RepID=UPI001E49DD6D|nr:MULTISPECIES: nuclear transport factor 2 family protein [unclassified Arthrobacter]MCC9173674.1 nuclear transport factor 2 family protein [Arthrobacter sp. zg-Y179]MCQ1952251.1 nuclear transport factor 2 family protein [Arthrobacter sp. zg-Y238]
MSELADITRRLERLEAVHEIENLMGRYAFYHSAYRDDLIPPLFADREDLVVEMPFGTFTGPDAARRAWAPPPMKAPSRDLTGEYVEHLLTTPVVEVAQDGRTASAAWISPGAEAHHLGWVEGNPLRALWYWGRYSADFVREDDAWRLWHFRLSATFITDYSASFTDAAAQLIPPLPPYDENGPDAPPRGQVPYSPVWDPRELPLAPEPYDTFPGPPE